MVSDRRTARRQPAVDADIRIGRVTRMAQLRALLQRLGMARADAVTCRHDAALAAVSHELRSPLTSVLGFAHVLRDPAFGLTDAERNELIGYIVDEAEVTLALVDDLLAVTDLARSGVVHVAAETVDDVAGTIREMVGRLPRLRSRALVVEGTAAAVCDAGRLRQIMRNLLGNAVEHGAEPITVSVDSDGSTARIRVTDAGEGIADEIAATLFDAERSAPNQRRAARSSGIGLWLSRDLARRMGGELRYLGSDGGTTFELSLPAAAPRED